MNGTRETGDALLGAVLPGRHIAAGVGVTAQAHRGLLVRHASADDRLAGSIRRADVDGAATAIRGVCPYATPPDARLAPWLIGTKLLLLFGALALATAAVGIHAAFAHAVAERQHEIAIRFAVGASRRRVLLMMLREGGAVAASGVMYGAIKHLVC